MYGDETLGSLILAASRVVGQSCAAAAPTLFEKVQQALRQFVGPPLKALHEPIDNWLASLPMSVAMTCAVGLYVASVIWVWGLRREFVFRGAPDQCWYRDLRIWATLVVIPYVAIYVMLGR